MYDQSALHLALHYDSRPELSFFFFLRDNLARLDIQVYHTFNFMKIIMSSTKRFLYALSIQYAQVDSLLAIHFHVIITFQLLVLFCHNDPK